MKATKTIFFSIIIILYSWCNINAQSHNLKPGLCSYAKTCSGCGVDPNAPKCQACSDIKKKEFEARKKSDEAVWAKAKAEKDAAEKVRLEKLRLAELEAKKVKEKKEADKIAQTAIMKKYKEIANKGRVNSNAKGNFTLSTNYNEKLECFADNNKKLLGFKLEGQQMITFPMEGNSSYVERIGKSNYFIVSVYNNNDLYYYIIDEFGQKFNFKGVENFLDVILKNNLVTINIPDSENNFTLSSNKHCMGHQVNSLNLFNSTEASEAYLNRFGYETCFSLDFKYYKIIKVKQYKLDINLHLLENLEGYILHAE